MKKKYKSLTVIAVLAIIFSTTSFIAQQKQNKPVVQHDSPTSGLLFNEIQRQDSLLFNAFNARNIDGMKKFFDPGLELYQDNIGVRNYTETLVAFGNLFKQDLQMTRKLVPNSLEVYPIKGYGAIASGQHRFSHLEDGKIQTATFKFMNIWRKKDGAWQITRLVTYDHPEDWK